MIIRDEPAFVFRGFMLDASRHFQPAATVKHVLDYMLSMKLNVFHWHLSDDQGWRVQSLKHPELNIYGSFMMIPTVFRLTDFIQSGRSVI